MIIACLDVIGNKIWNHRWKLSASVLQKHFLDRIVSDFKWILQKNGTLNVKRYSYYILNFFNNL